MSEYCTNCGTQIKIKTSLCSKCYLDPEIPKEIIDEELKRFNYSKREKALSSKLEYPGESSSLAFSIMWMIFIAFILSAITLGFFLVLIISGLIYYRVQEAHTKARLVRITENNFPEIFNLSKLSAYRLKIPLLPVYVAEDPILNAYAAGFWGNHWIVLHSAVLKQLNPEEVLFVIGHEMGHTKREHTTWLNLMPSYGVTSIPIISQCIRIIFNNWSIKAEYSADRAGLLANRDLESCLSALSMLATGHRNINIESYIKESYSLQKETLSRIAEFFGTHPYYANRIKNLYNFSKLACA